MHFVYCTLQFYEVIKALVCETLFSTPITLLDSIEDTSISHAPQQ